MIITKTFIPKGENKNGPISDKNKNKNKKPQQTKRFEFNIPKTPSSSLSVSLHKTPTNLSLPLPINLQTPTTTFYPSSSSSSSSVPLSSRVDLNQMKEVTEIWSVLTTLFTDISLLIDKRDVDIPHIFSLFFFSHLLPLYFPLPHYMLSSSSFSFLR